MKAGVSRSRLSHEPGAPEHCPAEIWRTRRRRDYLSGSICCSSRTSR